MLVGCGARMRRRRTGEVEEVGAAVDDAGYRVAVLYCGVIFVGPFRAHEAEGDGGFSWGGVLERGTLGGGREYRCRRRRRR